MIPKVKFAGLQWFQMPEEDPVAGLEEVQFRFYAHGEDSNVFLANGYMRMFTPCSIF